MRDRADLGRGRGRGGRDLGRDRDRDRAVRAVRAAHSPSLRTGAALISRASPSLTGLRRHWAPGRVRYSLKVRPKVRSLTWIPTASAALILLLLHDAIAWFID